MWVRSGGALAIGKSRRACDYIPILPLRVVVPISCENLSSGAENEGRFILPAFRDRASSESCQWPMSSASRCTAKGQRKLVNTRSPSDDDLLFSPRRVACSCIACQEGARRSSDPAVLRTTAGRHHLVRNKERKAHDAQENLFADVRLMCEEDEKEAVFPARKGKKGFRSSLSNNELDNPAAPGRTRSQSSERRAETANNETNMAETSNDKDKRAKIFPSSDFRPITAQSFTSSTGDLSSSFLRESPVFLDVEQPFVRRRSWHGKSSDRARELSCVKSFNPLSKPHEISFHSSDWTDKDFSFLTPLSGFTAPS